MKKIIILLLAILMLFSSCSFEATLSNIQERFFMSDREQANKYFDKILDAIQYKDVKALKSQKKFLQNQRILIPSLMICSILLRENLSYDDGGGLSGYDEGKTRRSNLCILERWQMDAGHKHY